MIRRMLVFAIMAMAATQLAAAQPRVRIIVPFPPGGAFDAMARAFAERSRATLGSVVVENRPGAGGNVALDDLSRAAPDGNTLLLGSGILHPTDPFATVAVLGLVPTTIAVSANLPTGGSVATLGELVDYARARSGRLSYGSTGTGTLSNMAGELFKSTAGVDMVHVPYKGAAQALTDLLGGHITMVVQSASAPLIHLHKGGAIKVLSVNAQHRSKALPDVPTAAEQGLPQLVCVLKLGLLAPANAPADMLATLRNTAAQVGADLDFQAELTRLGFEPGAGDLIDPENCRVTM